MRSQDMMDAPDSPTSPQTTSTFGWAQSKGGRGTADKETKVNFGAPGSSYSTKKFLEEYERAARTSKAHTNKSFLYGSSGS